MARIVDRPVPVWTTPGGEPRAFAFRGRRRVVEILETWRETGEWWEQDPPEERTVYRVRADDGGVYELDYREPAGRWFLYKVYD